MEAGEKYKQATAAETWVLSSMVQEHVHINTHTHTYIELYKYVLLSA